MGMLQLPDNGYMQQFTVILGLRKLDTLEHTSELFFVAPKNDVTQSQIGSDQLKAGGIESYLIPKGSRQVKLQDINDKNVFTLDTISILS